MSKINGRLTVTLYEAKELHGEDFGKMDPFAKVELCKQQYKTKVHKKGGDKATWGQSFTFTLLNVADTEVIHFQVWDEDLLSDDKVGRADLPLSSLAIHTDKKDGAWVQLVDFDNFKKIAGYIRIGVKFEGSGWPQPQESTPAPTPEHHEPPPKHEEYKPEHKFIPVSEKKEEVKLTDTLPEDYCLKVGHRITSKNEKYSAVMQHDGNFVVFQRDQPIWASKTAGTGSDLIQLQSDNNLVIVDISTGKPIAHWATHTAGQGTGKAKLVIQDDGNLVLYDGEGAKLWETGVPAGPKYPDTLKVEQTLEGGDLLRSGNGEYTAIFQKDGNFVIYQKGHTGGKWSTGTAGKGGNRLTLQKDHNLVLYGETALWSTGTAGKGASAKLVIQNDGNLILYDGATPLWASQGLEKKATDHLEINGRLGPWEQLTSPDGHWTATFQKDGNFVVAYDRKAKWSTRTNGTGANHIILQADHNLVILAGSTPKWATGTGGKGSTARLVLQDDGNLVLYDGTTVLWDRK
jgi:hypothetical protein